MYIFLYRPTYLSIYLSIYLSFRPAQDSSVWLIYINIYLWTETVLLFESSSVQHRSNVDLDVSYGSHYFLVFTASSVVAIRRTSIS